jgi:RNA polymerase sigma factor (sigma-70 family)
MIWKTDTTRNEVYNDRLFSKIFNSHFDCLFNYGMKITGSKELVEDSIQELFFRIWKNKIDLNAINNPKSYLFKGLRHQIINIIKLKQYQLERVEINETLALEFSHEDLYIQNQSEFDLRKKVLEALNKLSESQREVIYLRYFEDLSYEEIAEIMNFNIQSAKNNVFRGIVSLRKLLGVTNFSIYLIHYLFYS